MKTVCVYHLIDLDGWMSAAIVKHWFTIENNGFNTIPTNNSIDFIGYNYGQPIPDLSGYDKVIMCDISFPKKEMEYLHKDTIGNLIWIDHHISAIKDIDDERDIEDTVWFGPIGGSRDIKYGACELTWQYLFPSEPMPEIVRLLGRYDCFGHKNTEEERKVLEFQYGARSLISNYEEAYNELHNNIHGDHTENGIIFRGRFIHQYLCNEAKESYKNGFKIWFPDYNLLGGPEHGGRGFDFICINKERFNPINFYIDYHKDGYDGCACFHYDGKAKLYRFSLYNDNGLVDCSIIAKQFGGGGHKGASGFVLTQEQFNNLIQ